MTTPLPDERTSRVSRASDHEARLTALEDGADDDRKLLREVHAAIVGTTTTAGHSEQIRELRTRVDGMERARNLVTGVAVTAATVVTSAWAMLGAGPKPPHP